MSSVFTPQQINDFFQQAKLKEVTLDGTVTLTFADGEKVILSSEAMCEHEAWLTQQRANKDYWLSGISTDEEGYDELG